MPAAAVPVPRSAERDAHQHIRSTPGYPDGNWPPHTGMTLEKNLGDLRRHADDFARRVGFTFTFTVLDLGPRPSAESATRSSTFAQKSH
jgi:hypothetical protein